MQQQDLVADLDTELKICMCAVHVCRYLIEHRALCPLSVSAGLFRDYDMILKFASFIDEAPWERVNPRTGLKESWNGEWKDYTAEVSVAEGNCWVALLSLICSEEVRTGAYELTPSRVRSLLKLRRRLTDILIQQIPHLDILKRFVEEMHVSQAVGSGAGLIRSQGPTVTSLSPFAIIEVKESIFEKYMSEDKLIASEALSREELLEVSSRLADQLESMISFTDATRRSSVCAVCQRPGENQCSGCKTVVYCGRDCQLQDWTIHKKNCLKNA